MRNRAAQPRARRGGQVIGSPTQAPAGMRSFQNFAEAAPAEVADRGAPEKNWQEKHPCGDPSTRVFMRFAVSILIAVLIAVASCGGRTSGSVDMPLLPGPGSGADDGGAVVLGNDGGPIVHDSGQGGQRDAGACTPKSCAEQGFDCGLALDGCGTILECGSCGAGPCGAGGPNKCGGPPGTMPEAGPICTPQTCASLHASCGLVSDQCASVLSCGQCPLPTTCGGGGAANQCGCTPTTCAAQKAQCGTIADGCGGVLDCGACPSPQICGGR